MYHFDTFTKTVKGKMDILQDYYLSYSLFQILSRMRHLSLHFSIIIIIIDVKTN